LSLGVAYPRLHAEQLLEQELDLVDFVLLRESAVDEVPGKGGRCAALDLDPVATTYTRNQLT
jgi:hypothetical protein